MKPSNQRGSARATLAMLMTLMTLPAPGQQPQGQRPPINLIAVGFDIEHNERARDMLRDMVEAVRDSGAMAEMFLAGANEEELDQAMESAMQLATGGRIRLELLTASARPRERITVVHSDFTIEDRNAWIGFYERFNDRSQDYLSYTFLVNLNDRLYDVTAPNRRGEEYHFRIFLAETYEEAARSGPVQVMP